LSTNIEGIFWTIDGIQGFLGLAVRGTGERDSDVGDILLAQPAQQGCFIIYHLCQKSKARVSIPISAIDMAFGEWR
jgi:hypothetical protein